MSPLKKTSAFAPATVANLACGFDVLGLAVATPGDVVHLTAWPEEGTTTLVDIVGDGGVLPREAARNTAVVAIQAWRKLSGYTHKIDVRLEKKMPLGSGMGSSAASAVAAVVAANALLDVPLDRQALLPCVMEAERVACGAAHADNVAPSLLGGIVLIKSYEPLDVVLLPVPEQLAVVIVHPKLEVKTEVSRAILRRQIPLGIAVEQSSHLAGFVAGLYTADYGLIGRSLVDVIAEPYRSPLIPNFIGVKQAAMSAGALGCSISGSGPAMFALTQGLETAEAAGQAMQAAFNKVGVQASYYAGWVNAKGAYLLEP